MSLPRKPPFGKQCNYCGICCMNQLCELGQMAFPGVAAPCPGLDVRENGTLCSLVIIEAAAGMEPLLANALGIGCGCSMPDAETTDAQIEEFDRVSLIRIHDRTRKAA